MRFLNIFLRVFFFFLLNERLNFSFSFPLLLRETLPRSNRGFQLRLILISHPLVSHSYNARPFPLISWKLVSPIQFTIIIRSFVTIWFSSGEILHAIYSHIGSLGIINTVVKWITCKNSLSRTFDKIIENFFFYSPSSLSPPFLPVCKITHLVLLFVAESTVPL